MFGGLGGMFSEFGGVWIINKKEGRQRMVKNKKAYLDLVAIIGGILLISGGILFLINKTAMGIVVASLGLLIEAVRSLIKWLN